MITIASHPKYVIKVDPEKNRLYIKFQGDIRQPEEIQSFPSDAEKAISMVSKGFTVLANVRNARLGFLILTHFEQIQNFLIQSGMSRSAEIFSDDCVQKMQLNMVSRSTKLSKQCFSSELEGENWLDS